MAGSSPLGIFQKGFIMFLVNFCGKTVMELLDNFDGCQQTINRAAKENLPLMTEWYQELSQWQKDVVRSAALGRLTKEKGVSIPGTFQGWAEMRIRQHQRDTDALRAVGVSDLLTNTPGLVAPPLTPNGGSGHATAGTVQTPGGVFWGWAEGGTPDAQIFLNELDNPAGADLSPENADGVCVSVHKPAQ
jgi:hypothetical protein